MYVVATAGHVDHGKSTLVRALTGIEPDRWAEERRRGLTIDLGFAWTALDSGRDVAFVDVPGHERFLANMLAGLGPAPVVLFVVALDEGWRAQSSDHRDAIAALGIDQGVIVLSRADRAPDRVEERAEKVLAQVRSELVGTGLRDAPAVVVSAVAGTGLDDLRATLDGVLAAQPIPDADARVRIWVDRAFTIAGAGTVLTSTLPAGRVRVGDHLDLIRAGHRRGVVVRGLQSEGVACELMEPVSRIAVNVRGLTTDEVGRGDALVTPDAWWTSDVVDVRRVSGSALDQVPERITAHLGTASLQARLRPLGDSHARISLAHAIPIGLGDRLVLRDPGSRILGGVVVLDAEPPALSRRGDAARRARVLEKMSVEGDADIEVRRRGAVEGAHLRRLGIRGKPSAEVRVAGDWWVHPTTLSAWAAALRAAVEEAHRAQPLAQGVNRAAVVELLGLPSDRLVDLVAREAALEDSDGYLRVPGRVGLGPAEAAITALEQRLASRPFLAPEADDLTAAGLGARELAAAERAGRLLRIGEGIVLLPKAPALAMRALVALPQPFTTSEARVALGTTRRVVIPLLEHLDARGWTRRLDGTHRNVVR